jgi:UDPglucose 6-dehydrogenase
MNLTMVGTGYVGLVTGACFAESGNTVVCLDVDQAKIDMLNRGESPIYEPGLSEMIVRNHTSKRLSFTVNKKEAYSNADVIFICVGTPSDEDGSADLQYVLKVAEDIAEAIDAAGPHQKAKTVVIKSTVPVGTSHKVRDIILSRTSAPFNIADNPEFLKEGDAINDFMKPDRVVCGVESEDAAQTMRNIYEPFVRQGNPIFIMDVRSAEMVKYASNAMLACKISFVNEIARLCERYGADVKSVREGMCADSRIGNQFLYPGLGYGGSCFPKDTLAVCSMGREVNEPCLLNEAVHQVNQAQRPWFWKKISNELGNDLSGVTLAFWGIAFKPKTDDIRESPSIALMKMAMEAGAKVKAFDPEGMQNLNAEIPEVETCEDMYDCLIGADALVLATEWSAFRSPDFDRIGSTLKEKLIFDGRNIYRRHEMEQMGYTYVSVGRPTARPAMQTS